jgi:hypothetical protein
MSAWRMMFLGVSQKSSRSFSRYLMAVPRAASGIDLDAI